MTIEDLKNIKDKLDNCKPHWFSEMKVMRNPIIKDGQPILMVSDKDFEQFEKLPTPGGILYERFGDDVRNKDNSFLL